MQPNTLFIAFIAALAYAESQDSSCSPASTVSSVVISTLSSTATLYLEQETSSSTTIPVSDAASSSALQNSGWTTASATASSPQANSMNEGTGSNDTASTSASMAVFTGSAPASGVGGHSTLALLGSVLLMGYL